jgi:glutathione S-transferase
LSYDLAIGDRACSSWSLRGWLLFDAFGLPVKTHSARLYTDELPRLLEGFFPARTVPAMRTPGGTVVCESLAIAEELASRHPEAELWPKSPAARAVAPIRARPSPIFWKRAGASTASATPFAATRRWRTRKPGRSSWPFTNRKPFVS